ncbi:MAG: aldehyde ferredoxin oxidoreductase family protein [Acetobacteraceae bacterium]|nr:aldehyde ferredoxin oxidoreductase family protein [Acetobacteraceae bacterium]
MWVNLSTGRSWEEGLDPALWRLYLGGRGLGSYLARRHLRPDVAPLGERNPLFFLTGPLTGTVAPVGSKFVVVTRSPATEGFLDSYASGALAVELRQCGYDGLAVVGRAAAPSWLEVADGGVKLHAASELWGLDALEADARVRELVAGGLGPGEPAGCGVLAIGPAGENLVSFAGINSDQGRQAGRGGAGAVMGAKRLKAIAVRGTGPVPAEDPRGILELAREHNLKLAESPLGKARSRFGTPLTLDITNRAGMLPTRNFSSGVFPEAQGELDSVGVERRTVASRSCFGCGVACSKVTRFAGSGMEPLLAVEGPEYETLGMLGSNLGIASLPFVMRANHLCDRLGLDTISTGAVVGFAMECAERGLLGGEWAQEAPRFGDEAGALRLIEDIAFRRGLGGLLARGVRAAAQVVGQGSDRFAMHSKGLEFPAYEPRAAFGAALAYAVSPRGACHRRAWPPAREVLGGVPPFTVEGKAQLVKEMYDENCVLHSLLVCDFPFKFIPLTLQDYARYVELALGQAVTLEDFSRLADRVETCIRLVNLALGLGREQDTLPARTLEEPLPEGPPAGKILGREGLDRMLDEYYALRGWDREGRPRPETLQRLGLEDEGGPDGGDQIVGR